MEFCRDLAYSSKDLEWAMKKAVEFVRQEVSNYALSLLLEFQPNVHCPCSSEVSWSSLFEFDLFPATKLRSHSFLEEILIFL